MTPDKKLSQIAPPRCLALYSGPSPWSPEPVLIAELAADAEGIAQLALGCTGLAARWPAWLHDLQHDDETGAPIARVGAQLAGWTQGVLNEVRGDVRVAGTAVTGREALLFQVGYHDASLAWHALRLAIEAAGRVASFGQAGLDWAERALEGFWAKARVQHPDHQIHFLLRAARSRGVPCLAPVDSTRAWQFGQGARGRLYFKTASNADGFVGTMLAGDKQRSKQFMAALGVPIAPDVVVTDPAQLGEAVRRIGWPCAVKPLDGGQGRGVTAGVSDADALAAAFAHARRFTNGPVMIERHLDGDDHRLLVLAGRFASCVRRRPATVTGDGRQTLRELIDALNQARRTDAAGAYLKPVREDDAFERHLAGLGMRLDTVPAQGQSVRLRSVANLSMGGELDYMSERVHPELVALVEGFSRACGLATIGFDYVTTDIGLPWQASGGCFIEFNETPALDGLERHPGRPANWLGEALFGGAVGRIPLACLIVRSADWPAWRAWLAGLHGIAGLGMSGPGFVHANGIDWHAEGKHANEAAVSVLRHATVDRALLVSTDEALLANGYPADRFDELIVAAARLPASWVEVGRRIARRVSLHADVDADTARAAIAAWCEADLPAKSLP